MIEHIGTVVRGRQAPDNCADTTEGGSEAGLATHTGTATKDHAHTPEAPEVVTDPQGVPNNGTGATQTDRAPPGRSQSRCDAVKRARRRHGPTGLHPSGRRAAARGAKGTPDRRGQRPGKQRGACRQAFPTRGVSESDSHDSTAIPECTDEKAPQGAPDRDTGAPSTDRAPPGRWQSR